VEASTVDLVVRNQLGRRASRVEVIRRKARSIEMGKQGSSDAMIATCSRCLPTCYEGIEVHRLAIGAGLSFDFARRRARFSAFGFAPKWP
jgi:hypothetical protein